MPDASANHDRAPHSSSGVRVRFAPSPTGPIHVGNIHTTIFNWLYARHTGGTFVLRLEDTDQARSSDEWIQVIEDELRWLGLDWDEGPDKGGPYGPYRQMERLPLYQQFAESLVHSGHAYLCYCTPEELEAERKRAEAQKVAYKYSGRCCHLDPAEKARLVAEGRRPVIRFRVPDEGEVVVDDLIRGPIRFQLSEIEDFIIMRSNGVPLYNFAVVVDDITMAITHVVRGEGHISNTPKQWLMFRALGHEPPAIAHLGHLLGTDRAKLSKRKGDAYVGDYRARGFLPEALFNFLCLLGWAPDGDREFLTREEIIREFRLERCSPNAAVFDQTKLEWMNGVYIRMKPVDELTDLCLPFLRQAGLVPEGELSAVERARIERVVGLVHERIRTLAEVVEHADFFFKDEIAVDPAAAERVLSDPTLGAALRRVAEQLRHIEPFEAAPMEEALRVMVDELGLTTKALFQAIRVAVTGRTASPPLFDTLEAIGRERSVARLEAAATRIGKRA